VAVEGNEHGDERKVTRFSLIAKTFRSLVFYLYQTVSITGLRAIW